MQCPNCGELCERDSVDVGVGVIDGPWGCICGWSEHPEYNMVDGHRGAQPDGTYLDPYGGCLPKGNSFANLAFVEAYKNMMKTEETSENLIHYMSASELDYYIALGMGQPFLFATI